MHFIALFETAKDGDRVFDRRLADVHRLESPLERSIFFDVLLIFVQRGRADRTQLSACERGLQHVRRVHRAFSRAGTDQRVQLVDEQDDVAFALFDLFDDCFEPVLKFAAILRPGDHGAEVEGDDAFVFEAFRHIALDDAPRQSFDDRRLANARLSDEHGIIFRSAREDLNDAADFFVTSDDRIELPAARELRQIARVALEGLIFVFRILIAHALRAADALQRFEHRVPGDAMARQQFIF